MGKHLEEHHLLLDKLSQCEANADVVFRKWHNSDVKVNDIVQSNRDDIRDAKLMLAGHIRTTSGDDAKLVQYEKNVKKHELRQRYLWGAGISLGIFIIKEIYQFMMPII